jgi:hypothetical protein
MIRFDISIYSNMLPLSMGWYKISLSLESTSPKLIWASTSFKQSLGSYRLGNHSDWVRIRDGDDEPEVGLAFLVTGMSEIKSIENEAVMIDGE